MTTPPVADREIIPQFSNDEVLGLRVGVGGEPTDPENNDVHATLTNDQTGVVALDRAATRVGVGEYQVTLDGTSTDVPGYYTLTFYYRLGGNDERYQIYLQIMSGVKHYDNLDDDFRTVIDNVHFRFADLFDSPEGGPHLVTYYQTHFTLSRYAQLLRVALNKLNIHSQPVMTYTLDGVNGTKLPVGTWGGLLEQALYLEVIRHIRRAYVEQPALLGGEVTRHDRRDYLDRWGVILAEEQEAFEKSVEIFKIRHMFLGRPHALVSGGVYGRYGPTRLPLSAAARPRMWTRWY